MNVSTDEFLLNVRPADGLDILFLSVVIYLAWRWLQRRATRSAMIALLGLGALYVVSNALNMYLTAAVFQAGMAVFLFALVVVFQTDLRHAAERIAVWRPFAALSPLSPEDPFLHALVEAVSVLAKERTGALIVLPGRQPLERHVRGGVPVDGLVSIELLHSIFHTGSRGHDGAVIIRGERVVRLGVHLPLSANLAVIGDRGTRHAAALGLAERTDALVIIVSEERGTIALAEGRLLSDIDTAAELESRLLSFLERPSARVSPAASSRERLVKLGTQVGSLAIAAVLWFLFAFRIETVQRAVDDVPVEFRNLPEEWAIEDVSTNSVLVTLTGPDRAFVAFDPESLRAVIELREVSDGWISVPIREEHFDLPEGIQLRAAEPPTLRFQLRRMTTLRLPIEVVTQGRLPAGRELVAVTAEPEALAVRVPFKDRHRYERLLTEPINLSRVRETTSVTTPIMIEPGIRIAGAASPNVQVRIEVRREPGSAPSTDGSELRGD